MNKLPPPDDYDDNPEWTDADFAKARPANEVLPVEVVAMLVRGRGRPPLGPNLRKLKVNLRLSPDVVAALRAGGAGWQTRAERLLRDGLNLDSR